MRADERSIHQIDFAEGTLLSRRAAHTQDGAEDLFALAEDVILHRLRLNYEALADGKTTAGVLQEMLTHMGSDNEANLNGQSATPGAVGQARLAGEV